MFIIPLIFLAAAAMAVASASFPRLEEQFEKSVAALQAEHKAKLAKPVPQWLAPEPLEPRLMVFRGV